MITVIVKGNADDAELAARQRGISLLPIRQGAGDVVCYARNRFAAQIAKWFCEEGAAPFPPGSCLWYRVDGQVSRGTPSETLPR